MNIGCSISLKIQWFLMIFIIFSTIIFIVANKPYTTIEYYNTIENYTEKEPYTTIENYTEKEAYIVPIYHGYLFHNDILKDERITYILSNVTSYSFNYTGKNFKGQDQYNYTVCYQYYCYQYPNITDIIMYTDNVTKYKDIQKSREMTKYRNIQKYYNVNKTRYVNLSLIQRILQKKSIENK